jgi:hypothetical protein
VKEKIEIKVREGVGVDEEVEVKMAMVTEDKESRHQEGNSIEIMGEGRGESKAWNTMVLLTYGGVCSFPENRSSVFHLRAFQQCRPICISLLCTA